MEYTVSEPGDDQESDIRNQFSARSNQFSEKEYNNKSTTHGDVELYLESIVLQNDRLDYIKKHKVLLRQDHSTLRDKVKIISGGPAGMAPLHSGFVGPGMLTAAVLGDINCGPSFLSILAVLRILGKKHTPGILVIVMNNLTERLSFNLASQQAALDGIKVICVSVGEDCSGMGVSRVIGRRGLGGLLFLQKIAGAMAEDNKTLFEIYYVLTSLNRGSLGTIEASIGSGLNGEDEPAKFNSISQIVKEALYYILKPDAPYSLHVSKDDNVAILVNNLGGLTDFQMAIVTREVCVQVMANGINLLRVYSGRLLTSNTTNNFSISLLKINENLLRWLDFPANVISWPNSVKNMSKAPTTLNKSFTTLIERESRVSISPVDFQGSFYDKRNLGPKFTFDEAKKVVEVLMQTIKVISDLKEYLNNLDVDHNCGSALKKFMVNIKHEMDNKKLMIATPYGLLNHLAELAATTMPGFPGSLFSVLFCSASQSFLASTSHHSVCWCMWMDAAALARDALCAYTKVELGDYTVFDALHPFVETFTSSTVESFNAAVEAAIRGVDEAAWNHPQGNPDPVSYALAMTFRTVFTELQIYLSE